MIRQEPLAKPGPYGVTVAVAGRETDAPGATPLRVRYAIFAPVAMHELSSIVTAPTEPVKVSETCCGGALGEANESACGVTTTALAGGVAALTTIGTSSELAPSYTVTVQVPAASGVAVKVCGGGPPAPVTVTIPAQALASVVSVPGPEPPDAVIVNVCGPAPSVNVSVPVVVDSEGAVPEPTVMPIAAETFCNVTTNVQLPFAVGWTT